MFFTLNAFLLRTDFEFGMDELHFGFGSNNQRSHESLHSNIYLGRNA
jgi:hypothetical protein